MLFYENNLVDKIKEWENGKDKTGCATFCNILYTKRLFIPNELTTAKKFAFNRYNGLVIEVMIDKIRKTENANKLKKSTEAMERLMTGKKYGKL